MNDDSKFKCYKCRGTGDVLRMNGYCGTNMCPKCFGEGELDWVENARGGKSPHVSRSSSSCSSCSSYHAISKNCLEKKEHFQRRKSIYKKQKNNQ